MRKIAHISDLHFGRLATDILPALRASIIAAQPDVVVVSGDLTQRARAHEFQAARHFLDSLPQPQIIVPGNHDVPLYNVLARWLSPLGGYQRYIQNNLTPFLADEEIAVVGLNTARSLTIKNGRLNARQVEQACALMRNSAAAVMRILVTHHPFDVVDPEQADNIVGRADMAMAAFARCKVDLILAGHLHHSHVVHGVARYGADSKVLLIQAGTATSSRQRGEGNAWNLVSIASGAVAVTVMGWNAGAASFQATNVQTFHRGAAGWMPTSGTIVGEGPL